MEQPEESLNGGSLTGQSLSGLVSHGNQLGRTIGFLTANLPLPRCSRSAFGVYVSTVLLPDGRELAGITNVGVKPTVGSDHPLLEVHIFNFAEDIYENEIVVLMHERLRGEKRFASLQDLQQQIREDCEAAIRIHATRLGAG